MNSKPMMRDDIRGVLISRVSAVIRDMANAAEVSMWGWQTSCINCEHFEEKGRPGAYAPETCRLWNARPPARIIAMGCPSHLPIDDIPF